MVRELIEEYISLSKRANQCNRTMACLVAQTVKESACNAGDLGLIPGMGRSPGGEHGNPLQCSCLENPTARGAWKALVCGVVKSQT